MPKRAQNAAKYAAQSKSKKKKTPNRSYIPVSTVPYDNIEPAESGASKGSVEIATPTQLRRRRQSQIDYHYVVSDLKRIALVGGAMLVVLAVLALVIH